MSLALTTMWTNFVKMGHPTPDPRDLGVTWEPVTKDDIRQQRVPYRRYFHFLTYLDF